MQAGFQALQVAQRVGAGDSLDAPHAGGHPAFADDLEQADVAGARHVRAAAEFTAGADVEHAHGVAVLLAEQHHGAGLLRALDVHQPRLGGGVLQDLLVHTALDLGDLPGRDRGVVGEVEARLLGIHQAALLLHVAAQHLAQRLVHQVRDAVVALGGGAARGVHAGLYGVAHLQRALLHHAVVAVHVGLDLLRVFHAELHAFGIQHAGVAHLAAAFGVERRGVEHHDAALAGLEGIGRRAFVVERDHLAGVHQLVVAGEHVGRAAVLHLLVHPELAGRAAGGLLLRHGFVKAGHVHGDAALAAHILRQVQREAVGVVQLEGHVAWQLLAAGDQRVVQDFHAVGQGLEEPLFLGLQHLFHAFGLGLQARVGGAHQLDQRRHQPVEEGLLLAQLVAVADGAADDAALHVAASFVAGDHAVAHQEGGGADVVGDHLERGVGQIGAAGGLAGGGDQLLEQVDLVVAVHVLQDGGQALQAHAGVDAGRGQPGDAAVLVHLELHEHVVPDLDEAVAVFLGAAGRAAGDVRAVVVEDLAARAAGAGVGHHPEVVALVLAALVVADADHALGRQADVLGPDVVGLVVLVVDGGRELVGRQAVDLGEQFPAPGDRLFLEVVAKAPVAQHLEEGVVARGVAHVLEVVVLAAGAQAGLHAGRAHVGALVAAQEHVLELHHTAVGEHQCRVVARHQRAAGHDGVALALEEVEEALADVRDGHGGFGGFHHVFGVWPRQDRRSQLSN